MRAVLYDGNRYMYSELSFVAKQIVKIDCLEAKLHLMFFWPEMCSKTRNSFYIQTYLNTVDQLYIMDELRGRLNLEGPKIDLLILLQSLVE